MALLAIIVLACRRLSCQPSLISDPGLSDEEKLEELRRRGWARSGRGEPPLPPAAAGSPAAAEAEELPPTARWLQLQREASLSPPPRETKDAWMALKRTV